MHSTAHGDQDARFCNLQMFPLVAAVAAVGEFFVPGMSTHTAARAKSFPRSRVFEWRLQDTSASTEAPSSYRRTLQFSKSHGFNRRACMCVCLPSLGRFPGGGAPHPDLNEVKSPKARHCSMVIGPLILAEWTVMYAARHCRPLPPRPKQWSSKKIKRTGPTSTKTWTKLPAQGTTTRCLARTPPCTLGRARAARRSLGLPMVAIATEVTRALDF